MKTFAIIENGIVLNTIVAESKAIADEITASNCIEYTTQPAETGGTYVNGKFIRVQPFPSWISNGDSSWKAPVDKPVFDEKNPKYYTWDESTTSWIEVSE